MEVAQRWQAAGKRSYIGLWDELSVFNRALTAQEVKQLNGLGVTELMGKKS